MPAEASLVNPFAISLPCRGYVPSWGRIDADFHLVRGRPADPDDDHESWLRAAGNPLGRLLASVGLLLEGAPANLYVSFVHGCPDSTVSAHRLEAVFDAELRAITAHVLLPVGETATAFVLDQYTSRDPGETPLADLHANEISSGAWIVLPLQDPASWTDAETNDARVALKGILGRDYRREADLGRHLTGSGSYLVR